MAELWLDFLNSEIGRHTEATHLQAKLSKIKIVFRRAKPFHFERCFSGLLGFLAFAELAIGDAHVVPSEGVDGIVVF